MKAIIFDFNGTLLKDSHIHAETWIEFICEKTGYEMSEKEFMNKAWGKDNTETIKEFLNIVDIDEIEKLSRDKESKYRELCIREKLELIEGAEVLFDYLKEKNVPITIATGSIKENVDFYFERFRLDRWFEKDKVIYDDGSIPSKPDPVIYKRACKALNVKPEECIVIEDTKFGVISASKAGIKQIYVVNEKNSSYGEVTQFISDFYELKKLLQKNNLFTG